MKTAQGKKNIHLVGSVGKEKENKTFGDTVIMTRLHAPSCNGGPQK